MIRIAALILLIVALLPAHAQATGRGDRGPDVVEVQTLLAGYGYTVTVDGIYGKQTERAVRSWQRSNGLTVDGIAGPATLASLRGATRINNVRTVTGLNDLGFAPDGLTGCDEARYYRQQAGLPDRFDGIVWRESNCRNDVTSRTGCCVGYLQLHYIIFADHRMTGRLAACQATWANVRGDDPASKQRQMCAARALYDVMGMSPWRLTA